MTKPQLTAAQRKTAAAREARTRRIMRIVAIVAGTPVAIVAGYASYLHIVGLAIINGQPRGLAHLAPISIDGLMIVAAVAIVAHRRARVPQLSFGIGAVLTLAANALSVHPVSTPAIAYTLAATPAAALLLSSEMLLRLCLPTRTAQPRKRAPRKAAQPARKRATAPARTRTTQPTIAPAAAPVAA